MKIENSIKKIDLTGNKIDEFDVDSIASTVQLVDL